MRYKYRERYKLGYFYVEEFDEDKQKYIVLYITYDIMDAHMWLKNHRKDADYVPTYTQYEADHNRNPWGGGVWLRSDPKKGEYAL